MYTVQYIDALKENSKKEISEIKRKLNFEPELIADLGANIGYYSSTLLRYFPNSEVHAFEPIPEHVNYLQEIQNDRFHVHPYGIFNENTQIEIGMRDDGRMNNGTYSIFNKVNSVVVEFKHGNSELIRPDFVKIDVEGSELAVLDCEEFFENTKAIYIELVYKDDFNQNEKVTNRLIELRFTHTAQITKNDSLWLR
jgi:FkbM family methyltransferase